MKEQERSEVSQHFQSIYQRANRIVEIALLSYFSFGLGIAFFYDTWMIALTVGTLSLGLHRVARLFFPDKTLNQYVASLAFGIFMAQFIYQMHGMFEMHFFAFIGVVLLIVYQNWKAFIPITLFIVIHHALFAYLQFTGYEEVYFTQLDYMPLRTFLFHVGLAAVIIALCAYWAFDFRQHTLGALMINLKIQDQLSHTDQNIAFATEIAKGNLEATMDWDNSDELGHSLINMQQKLKEGQQREHRERFMNVGLAEISDILRRHVDSLEELSNQVIAYLVRYLKANQGAIFIADDEENQPAQTLTMTACYAYNKKKYLNSTISVGQGLVGQTFLEKESIYLKQIPQDYINITSGLGEASPNSLLLIPLIVDETIEGVIEIASFKEFSQDDKLFLEKVGESIASIVMSTKSKVQMAQLLEASKMNEEELRNAEEETRQNMEELSATQEEMARKEKEYQRTIEELRGQQRPHELK